MMINISNERTVNTDHIAVIKPSEYYPGEYDIIFSCGQWTIRVSSEDKELILNSFALNAKT